MKGDKKAIGNLIEEYYEGILYNTIQKFGVEMGTDVAHKVVVEIIESIRNLKDPDKFEVWMLRLMRFVCMNEYKMKYRDQAIFTEFSNGDPNTYYVETDEMEFIPEDYVINAEKRQRILEIIKMLPQNYQDILINVYYHQLTYEEIAEVQGINKTKIKNDLYRGKRLLKEKLEILEGKEFAYSISYASVPILTKIFLADADDKLTPSVCAGFIGLVQQSLAALGTHGGSSVMMYGAVKIIASSVLTVSLAGTGFWLLQNNTAPKPMHPVSIETSTSTATEKATKEEPKQIQTLEDMIGVEYAKQLREFEKSGVNESQWLDFIKAIGAKIDSVAAEYNCNYTTYLLTKGEKQLLLADKQVIDSKNRSIIFYFGEVSDPPMMIKIIMEFDKRR